MTAAQVAMGSIRGKKEAMKVLDDLQLPPRLLAALQAARDRVMAEFDVDRMVLFGSIVEGTSDEESDVDLLVVLKQSPSRQRRDRIPG
jgi:predicted nucleotidyltransferase